MKVQYTEKDFRRRFTVISNSRIGSSLEDDAVAAVLELGVEFAPEPLELPEKLWRDEDMNTRFDHEPGYFSILPHDTKAALLDELHARYNAYPRLRRVVERLVRSIACVLPAYSSAANLRIAVEAVTDELAKGPKP